MTERTLFLLFNHQITETQREDASKSLGVGRIMDLPAGLKQVWGDIPADLPEIGAFLEPVRKWLEEESRPGDFVLIQGDFGACYLMAGFAFEKGLVPVYSTTDREVEEERGADGLVKVTHAFRHRIYRKYGV